jgi:hypothetical protein
MHAVEQHTTDDRVAPGDTIAGIGRVVSTRALGHWTLLGTEDGGEYLANGGIVNLDRWSAVHLRRVVPAGEWGGPGMGRAGAGVLRSDWA